MRYNPIDTPWETDAEIYLCHDPRTSERQEYIFNGKKYIIHRDIRWDLVEIILYLYIYDPILFQEGWLTFYPILSCGTKTCWFYWILNGKLERRDSTKPYMVNYSHNNWLCFWYEDSDIESRDYTTEEISAKGYVTSEQLSVIFDE